MRAHGRKRAGRERDRPAGGPGNPARGGGDSVSQILGSYFPSGSYKIS